MVKGTERKVSFQIPIIELKKWDSEIHDWKIYPGEYKIRVGGDARDSRLISAFTLPQPADGRNN
jgi:beta-glucosidase